MKLNLTLIVDQDVPPSRPEQRPSLKDKVEYAIDCIDCGGYNKSEAILFLRKVHNKLEQMHPVKEDAQILIDMIKPVLGEYGTEHLEGRENTDGEA
jgi:hypothetical protein